MLKIGGINLLGVLLAAVAMFFVGYLFYGLLFSEQWMAARGYTLAMFEASPPSPLWMLGGFIIELVIALGLGILMAKRGVSGLAGAVKFTVLIALLIGFPILGYDFVYGYYHDLTGLLVDWSHMFVSFGVAGAILSFFD